MGQLVELPQKYRHPPTGTLVGSHVCQTRRDNVIEAQDSLVRGIVELLMLRPTERERRVLAHNVPASARAYEFYLRANNLQRQRTFESMSMARDLYRAGGIRAGSPPGFRVYLDLAALAADGRETEAAELLAKRNYPGEAVLDSLRLPLQGDHTGSIAIAKASLDQNAEDDPEANFYLARHLARDGAHADALKTMHDLASEGFFCSTALRCDPWLRPLSLLPDFQDVLKEVLRREADAGAAFRAAGGDTVLS